MPQGFPVSPQGLDLVEPVMYLAWTGDVPIVYPSFTRVGERHLRLILRQLLVDPYSVRRLHRTLRKNLRCPRFSGQGIQ